MDSALLHFRCLAVDHDIRRRWGRGEAVFTTAPKITFTVFLLVGCDEKHRKMKGGSVVLKKNISTALTLQFSFSVIPCHMAVPLTRDIGRRRKERDAVGHFHSRTPDTSDLLSVS